MGYYTIIQVLLTFLLPLQLQAFYVSNDVSSSTRISNSVIRMAQAASKQPSRHNVPGNLFVDESCIDCDVCRWMCPSVFGRKGLRSAVLKQPDDNSPEKLQAFAAMVACPVGSIRTHSPDPMAKEAVDVFPAEIDPERIPNVYHCGYHALASFGATSYFIKRPTGVEGGNIMIDCPRYNSRYVG